MVRATARSAAARGVSAFLAALAAATAAGAAAPAPLAWKFAPGEAIRYQMVQKTVTELTANGQPVTKTTVTQTVDTTWAVQSVDPAGAAEMTQTIDRFRTRVESQFGAFDYDSQDPKPPEGAVAKTIVPTVQALVGARFRFKMTPQGELSDVRVPPDLLKTLRASGPASGAGLFTEDGLKSMITDNSLVLPADPAKPWTRQARLPSPPIGTQVIDKTYTYEGTDPATGAGKIGLKVVFRLEPDPASKLDAKIAAQDGTGVFLFDTKAGRVASADRRQKLEFVIAGPKTARLVQTQDSESHMTLVGPAARPPK